MEHSPGLSGVCGGDVWLKLENQQVSGSFKIRGAANKILLLSEEERGRGVVTASSGNHAQGVGYAARELGVKATVVVPERTPGVKIDAIRRYGVELLIEGDEYMDSERLARRLEREEGKTFVSAYNDAELIMGQATVGLEMVEDSPDLDVVLVPVGGGGLASGVASVFKQVGDAKVIGVQSVASPVMYECVKRGEIFDMPLEDSVAEGLHGGLEQGSISFDICKELIVREIELPIHLGNNGVFLTLHTLDLHFPTKGELVSTRLGDPLRLDAVVIQPLIVPFFVDKRTILVVGLRKGK